MCILLTQKYPGCGCVIFRDCVMQCRIPGIPFHFTSKEAVTVKVACPKVHDPEMQPVDSRKRRKDPDDPRGIKRRKTC